MAPFDTWLKQIIKHLRKDLAIHSDAHSWYKHCGFPRQDTKDIHVPVLRKGKYIPYNFQGTYYQDPGRDIHFHVVWDQRLKEKLDPTLITVWINCFWRGVEPSSRPYVRNTPRNLNAWWEKHDPEEFQKHHQEECKKINSSHNTTQILSLFQREQDKVVNKTIAKVSKRLTEFFTCLHELIGDPALLVMDFAWP